MPIVQWAMRQIMLQMGTNPPTVMREPLALIVLINEIKLQLLNKYPIFVCCESAHNVYLVPPKQLHHRT